jgi:hypothetical protein
MVKRSWIFLTAALVGSFMPQAVAGVITLSGATAFSANADGSWNNAGITATGGCCQLISVEETTFTGSSANYAPLPLELSLSLGTNIVYLESPDWTSSFGVAFGGVNLFFDDSLAADISAVTVPTFDQTVTPGFGVIAGGLNTASLADDFIPSSGSLSFDDGSETVTLTGLQWVGGSGSNPYDPTLTVQQATLVVSADDASGVPEPGSLLLMGGGLGLLALFRRRA